MATKVWFGLAEVKPKNENVFDGALGAYVNVLALANSSEDFLAMVQEALAKIECSLIELEDVHPITFLKSAGRELDPEILELEEKLSNEEPILFDEFQAYEED